MLQNTYYTIKNHIKTPFNINNQLNTVYTQNFYYFDKIFLPKSIKDYCPPKIIKIFAVKWLLYKTL